MTDFQRWALNLLVATFAYALVGCPDPKVPEPNPDGGLTCEMVCAHWSDLDCDEAKPTPAGESCVDVCVNIQKGNLPDDLECQASVTSCDQINDC